MGRAFDLLWATAWINVLNRTCCQPEGIESTKIAVQTPHTRALDHPPAFPTPTQKCHRVEQVGQGCRHWICNCIESSICASRTMPQRAKTNIRAPCQRKFGGLSTESKSTWATTCTWHPTSLSVQEREEGQIQMVGSVGTSHSR